MKFDLKKPCKDCPFIKGTKMILRKGRMEEIAESTKHDLNIFPCHKTTDGKREDYQACMGALAYGLEQHNQLPVLARIHMGKPGSLRRKDIQDSIPLLEKPGKWERG